MPGCIHPMVVAYDKDKLVPGVLALPPVWWSAVAGHKCTEIEADLSGSNTTRQARLLIILWKQMA
jgi:hypothetical protein